MPSRARCQRRTGHAPIASCINIKLSMAACPRGASAGQARRIVRSFAGAMPAGVAGLRLSLSQRPAGNPKRHPVGSRCDSEQTNLENDTEAVALQVKRPSQHARGCEGANSRCCARCPFQRKHRHRAQDQCNYPISLSQPSRSSLWPKFRCARRLVLDCSATKPNRHLKGRTAQLVLSPL